MREAFALQKLLTFFQQKILAHLRKFNETLTNDVVSFEQPGPAIFIVISIEWLQTFGYGAESRRKVVSSRLGFAI